MNQKHFKAIGTILISCAFISCGDDDLHDAMVSACEAQYRASDLCETNFEGSVSSCIQSLEDVHDRLLKSSVGTKCDNTMKRYLNCMEYEYDDVRSYKQCYDFIYDYEYLCMDKMEAFEDCVIRYTYAAPDGPEVVEEYDSDSLYSLSVDVCRLEGSLVNNCTEKTFDVGHSCTYSNQSKAVDSLLKGHENCRQLYRSKLECDIDMYQSINSNCDTYLNKAYYIPDDAEYDPVTGQYEARGWQLKCEAEDNAFNQCMEF